MKENEFKKLKLHLPRQPIINERPWELAGWVLALAVTIMVAFAYLRN